MFLFLGGGLGDGLHREGEILIHSMTLEAAEFNFPWRAGAGGYFAGNYVCMVLSCFLDLGLAPERARKLDYGQELGLQPGSWSEARKRVPGLPPGNWCQKLQPGTEMR